MKRALQRTALAAVLLTASAGAALEAWISDTVLPPLDVPMSVTVTDRNGKVLRVYAAADERWRLPVAMEQVDRGYLDQLIAYEDKRFYHHHGVDPRALLRAAGQAVWRGEITSGGSTLTMQVARLLEDGSTGKWQGKLRQIRLALALERRLTKREILELYLARAPMGGNLEGVRAAAFSYFGKDAKRLTPSESALLVALPQAPESRRPDRAPDAALAARNRVLTRVTGAGVIDAEALTVAIAAKSPRARLAFPMLAPQLTDRLRQDQPKARFLPTTLDAGLQEALENLLNRHVLRRHAKLTGAIMVMDHRTGEVLASVGGPDYLNAARSGFLDMTQAVRSPGSALKPVIYALAFEDGLAHPQTLLHDRPTRFGEYEPQNFDKTWRGTISAERALQLSLNVPAVALLDQVGPAQMQARMRRLGVNVQTPGGRAPGLALALGGAGLTLQDMVRLYAALANGGTDAGLHLVPGTAPLLRRDLTQPVAAWYVSDILSRAPRPVNAAGRDIAFKTGTSYGHRDAWALGFDGAHVVGVWLGRADAAPMPGKLGIDAAAPLLFEVFSNIAPQTTPLPPPPRTALTIARSELPRPLRELRTGAVVDDSDKLTIAYPPDGARVELGRSGALVIKVRQGQGPLTWMIDGQVVRNDPFADALVWLPEAPGFVAVSVVDAKGQAARTQVFVE